LHKHGRETWYGQWHANGRLVKRRLGPKRPDSSNEGLTKPQAEQELRRLVEAERVKPVLPGRITVAEAGEKLMVHLEAMGRKRSTLRSYRSQLRSQIVPRLGELPLARVRREDIEAFVAFCLRDGVAPKTVHHLLGILHSVFEYAIRQRWALENPCARVARPTVREDEDIRFLEPDEVEALLRGMPETDFGRLHRVLYVTAVMTGMRQGELLALRWCDVDWTARRVRIRRNIVRGEVGSPQSRRGSRSVPLADRLGGELDVHHQRTLFRGEQDLVFANPRTGRPLKKSSLAG
jgi:integrase